MKKVLISFVGKNKYTGTRYRMGESVYETDFFPEAAKQFCNPDFFCLIMTEKSYEHHGEKPENLNAKVINIPDGKNEEEIWKIFNIISEEVSRVAGEHETVELSIDITHGFRSLPLIALAIAVYLRSIKNINISNILYGAFDAKDENTNESPVFELSTFAELIEWAFAVSQLVKNGNASSITNLMKKIHDKSYRSNYFHKSKHLKTAAQRLEDLTEALAINHIGEAVEKAKGITDVFSKSLEDVYTLPEAAPIKEIISLIPERFKLLEEANGELFNENGFKAHCEAIKYYLENSQYVQAITVAREAFISKFCILFDYSNILDYKNDRKIIEEHLGSLSSKMKEIGQNPSNYKIGKLWNDISGLRNEIDHAFMRENPTPSKTAINKVTEICKQVIEFLGMSSDELKNKYPDLLTYNNK